MLVRFLFATLALFVFIILPIAFPLRKISLLHKRLFSSLFFAIQLSFSKLLPFRLSVICFHFLSHSQFLTTSRSPETTCLLSFTATYPKVVHFVRLSHPEAMIIWHTATAVRVLRFCSVNTNSMSEKVEEITTNICLLIGFKHDHL